MQSRRDLLQKLTTGDIFHAESPNGASLICLTLSINSYTVTARTVTTQMTFYFDINSGIALSGKDLVSCTIDSIMPLPIDIYQVMLGLDKKFRCQKDFAKLKLTDKEIQGLLFVEKHYLEIRFLSL